MRWSDSFLRLFTEHPASTRSSGLKRSAAPRSTRRRRSSPPRRRRWLHGREAAEPAAETARRTFAEGEAAEGLPTIELPAAELKAGIGVLAALVRAGLASSNSEARRLVKGGGARVNDEPVNDDRAKLTDAHVNADGVIKLSLGKKRHVLVKPV